MKTIVVGTPPFLVMPNQGSLPNPKRRLNAKAEPYACLIFFNTDSIVQITDTKQHQLQTNTDATMDPVVTYVPVIFNGPSN